MAEDKTQDPKSIGIFKQTFEYRFSEKIPKNGKPWKRNRRMGK